MHQLLKTTSAENTFTWQLPWKYNMQKHAITSFNLIKTCLQNKMIFTNFWIIVCFLYIFSFYIFHENLNFASKSLLSQTHCKEWEVNASGNALLFCFKMGWSIIQKLPFWITVWKKLNMPCGTTGYALSISARGFLDKCPWPTDGLTDHRTNGRPTYRDARKHLKKPWLWPPRAWIGSPRAWLWPSWAWLGPSLAWLRPPWAWLRPSRAWPWPPWV